MLYSHADTSENRLRKTAAGQMWRDRNKLERMYPMKKESFYLALNAALREAGLDICEIGEIGCRQEGELIHLSFRTFWLRYDFFVDENGCVPGMDFYPVPAEEVLPPGKSHGPILPPEL